MLRWSIGWKPEQHRERGEAKQVFALTRYDVITRPVFVYVFEGREGKV
jgi:hypothetical protein